MSAARAGPGVKRWLGGAGRGLARMGGAGAGPETRGGAGRGSRPHLQDLAAL